MSLFYHQKLKVIIVLSGIILTITLFLILTQRKLIYYRLVASDNSSTPTIETTSTVGPASIATRPTSTPVSNKLLTAGYNAAEIDLNEEQKRLSRLFANSPLPAYRDGLCIEPFLPTIHSTGNYVEMLAHQLYSIDKYGVVMLDYGKDYNNAGIQYNPYVIGMLGSKAIDSWCMAKDTLALRIAYAQAKWLVKNGVSDGDFTSWKYNFANNWFLAESGWTSSFGNAYGMTFLTQMYSLTKDPEYLDIVNRVVNSYRTDVEDGGVSAYIPGKGVFFEEVAGRKTPPAHILNAHIVSLRGLEYVYRYTKNEQALKLMTQGIQTFKNFLSDYDAGVTTLYSLGPNYPHSSNRNHYAHYTHIEGAYWAYNQTQDPIFLQYALQWVHYAWKTISSDDYLTCITCFKIPPPEARSQIQVLGQDYGSIIFDLHELQKVHSFGYNSIKNSPRKFNIAVSNDSDTWREVVQVSNYDRPNAIYDLQDIETRYLRFSWEELNDPATHEVQFGVIRIDNASYWNSPILMAVSGNGELLLNNTDLTEYLHDGDYKTGVQVDSTITIYGDLQKESVPSTFTLSRADSMQIADVLATIEVSDDLNNWQMVTKTAIIQNNQIHIHLLRGWRYFRLRLTSPKSWFLSELDIR